MDNSYYVRPALNVLSDEQIQRVHSHSLQILAEPGIRVDSQKALDVFKRSKSLSIEGNRVRIQPDVVEWAIKATPPSIDIYSRKGEKTFSLGKDATKFGVGVTNLFYQEPDTDEVIPFQRKHMATGACLGENLDAFDLVSTIGILKDVPLGEVDLLGTLEMVANTYKPLVLLISDPGQFLPVMDLIEYLVEDLYDKPCVIPYFNPVTPLVINQDTGDKMLAAIERGLPIIYSNYGMAGTTTPINPAGTLALLNAELLSGLVLGQLARQGAGIILGSLPAYFDMKTMIDFYDPLTILLSAASSEMMAYYKIPHAGTSGSGLGWGMDLPASGIMWLNHISACLGKTGLSPFVGGSLGSKAFSPKNVIYSNDIIVQARRFANGFSLDDHSVGLQEIIDTGPGGNFLTTKSTRQNYKSAYFESKIFPHLSLEKWQQFGQPKAEKYLVDKTMNTINSMVCPQDHDEIIWRGEEFIYKINDHD